VLDEVLKGRLRPLVLHDDDWTLLVDLRRTLGVSDEEPLYAPPRLAPYSDEVLALHMFVVRHGALDGAYMPVARRGRKYSYLDIKIARYLLQNTKRKRKSDVKDTEDTPKTKRRAPNTSSEMRYWRHQSWSASRMQQPLVAEALEEMDLTPRCSGWCRTAAPDHGDLALSEDRMRSTQCMTVVDVRVEDHRTTHSPPYDAGW